MQHFNFSSTLQNILVKLYEALESVLNFQGVTSFCLFSLDVQACVLF